MADCEYYLELISAYVDGALAPAEIEELNAHLALCPDCRELLEDLTALHAAMPEEEAPPEGFRDRVMTAIAAQEKVVAFPKKRRSRWTPVVTAAAVFALVIVGYGPLNRWISQDWSDSKPADAVVPPMENRTAAVHTERSLEVQSQEPLATYDSLPIEDGAADIGDFQSNSVTEDAAPDAVETVTGTVPDQKSVLAQGSGSPDGGIDFQPDPPSDPAALSASGAMPHTIRSFTSVRGEPGDAGEEAVPEETAFDAPTPVPFALSRSANSGAEEPDASDVPMLLMLTAPNELAITPVQALDLLLETCPIPEEGERVESDDFLGWQTPYVPVEEEGVPDGRQVSTQLIYCGLSPNEKYHEFWLYNSVLDDPAAGTAHNSTLNFYAVPLDGGEILVQRGELEDGSEESMAAYQAGIESYLQAVSE